jgi:L-fuconolactonase
MRLDAHQHFWYYNSAEHVWMTDKMEVLKRDYLPKDLKPLLHSIGFDGTIAVQARQVLQETEWLLELSNQYEFIKGIVGWVDVRSSDIRTQLEKYSQHPKFKGVRHVVHDEPDDNFMLLPEFQRGIAALKDFNLTYDLLLFYRHLPVAVKLVEKFPEHPFVVDHISKPAIKDKMISPWKEDIEELATYDNVYCKLSGMVTETHWRQWEVEEFKPYLDIVIGAFGPERVMIGSDWPVCTLSGDYQSVMNIVMDYVQQFPAETQKKILGGNCARFYGVTE